MMSANASEAPPAEEYTFLTLAGPADTMPGDMDGPGATARFSTENDFMSRPSGIAVDGHSNVYVADQVAGAIRKIAPDGWVTSLAGFLDRRELARLPGVQGSADGYGGWAQFGFFAAVYAPVGVSGMAADHAGNVFVGDMLNSTIRKIDTNGRVTTVAGQVGQRSAVDGPAGVATLRYPHYLALDSTGNLFVTDRNTAVVRKIAPDGSIMTVSGQPGQTGSTDGPAGQALFSGPRGIAVDAQGNLFVADTYNHTLRKISTNGMVSTVAGSPGQTGTNDGAGLSARFEDPAGVCLDPLGNLYVTDPYNDTIRKIDPAGVVTTWAGAPLQRGTEDGPRAGARFFQPEGITMDGAGNLWVMDSGNLTVRKITPAGEVTTVAGLAPEQVVRNGVGSAARFKRPADVAVDAAGNVFVTDTYALRKISTNLEVTLPRDIYGNAAVTVEIGGGVVVDGLGNVIVADTKRNWIKKLVPYGQSYVFAGSLGGYAGSRDGPSTDAQFNAPMGLALDSATNLYVADTYNHTIRKVTPGALVTTVAGLAGQMGTQDGVGNQARFHSPKGVAVDSAGNLFVADTGNFTIRKITPDGDVSTYAGQAGQGGYTDGAWSVAKIMDPVDVAVDGAGNVYVLDRSLIRKITPDRQVTTVAGKWWGNADGTGTDVRMTGTGLAIDKAGRLFVSDSAGMVRIGIPACSDRPVVDLPLAPVGVTRQLDTAPQTADGWQWTWVRRPSNSHAELSSATVRNPTFTPDVPDLYIFRLLATNSVTGEAALRTVEIRAVPNKASVLTTPERQGDGSARLNLVAQTNLTYAVDVSTNLQSWTNLTNVTPTNASTPLNDPAASQHPQRFYQAHTP